MTIIILTFNEEIHIRRLLENISPVAKDIVIVDSFSTDRTLDIINDFSAEGSQDGSPFPRIRVFQNPWPGNQASQFNWALKNVDIDTEWIMRLDADEYLSPELIERIKNDLPSLPQDVNGIEFRRKNFFLGKKIKGGTGPVYLLRTFRNGKGVCEERLMDEHIVVTEGSVVRWDEEFYDDNLNDLSWWTKKHNGYALREAASLLDEEYGLSGLQLNDDSKANRKKSLYLRLPLFWRSFAYFLYRYFLRGGFLEGKEGFMWCFLQGWWYRTLVDAKIFEIKRRCGKDPSRIREYLDLRGIDLR